MADIVLFPAERRLGFIRRQAASVAGYRPASRARTIAHQLARQHDYLLRLGIDPDEAKRHVETLHAEIEARLPGDRRGAR